MNVLYFDTETTGFRSSTYNPGIVQIAAVLQDDQTKAIKAEINLIVQPGMPIPERVAKIHGITDEVASQFGVPNDMAEAAFIELVRKADRIVAHNLAFDYGIVQGIWPFAFDALKGRQSYCTMVHATNVCKLPGGRYHGADFPNHKPPKLIEAYRYFFGTDFDGAHNAMNDVKACQAVYLALQEENQFDPQINAIICSTAGCNWPTPSLWRYELHVIGEHLQPETMPATS